MALNVGYISRETTSNLSRNPTLTIASVVTVAVALMLAGVAFLVGKGATETGGEFKEGVKIRIFMKPDASEKQLTALRTLLDDNPEVKNFSYVNKEQAFKEFKKLYRDSPTLLEIMTEDTTPTSFLVKPRNPDVESVLSLRSVFARVGGVLQVVTAAESVAAIQELSRKVLFGVLVAAAINGLSAVLLIYNTLRTAMFARRREIEVMKLVGATNWFIRVPFIAEGIVQSILGGLLAFLMLLGVNRFFFSALGSGDDQLALFEHFSFSFGTISWYSALLTSVGVLVGGIGSAVAVTRFLDV